MCSLFEWINVLLNHHVTEQDPEKPKAPIVLAHGLCGFDQLHLAGRRLPGIQYWRGIESALEKLEIEVITASVGPIGSIEERAASLSECIAKKANGRTVNIVA